MFTFWSWMSWRRSIGAGPAEVVGVGLVEPELVQVANVGVDLEVDVALVGVGQLEAVQGRVGAEVILLSVADGELGAAPVRDPDTPLIVAPGPAPLARHGAGGPQQGDARLRVGRADLTLPDFRGADHRGRRGGGFLGAQDTGNHRADEAGHERPQQLGTEH